MRTLINLRPSWVLLSRDAHYLTCLCDRCVNVQLILRCLTAFVKRVRQYGTPSDIAALVSVDLSSSVSNFISTVLHPKLEHQKWHQPACYSQSCESSDSSPCGSKALWKLFHPLQSMFGTTEIQLSQHLVVTYVKVVWSKGSKMEQVDSIQTIYSIVDLLDQRVFGNYHQLPFIMHKLKMLLGSKMRKDIHQNLTSTDVVCYTDYSKEFEALDNEQCKSSAFGASNVTIQLIGQIFELKVLPSSPPTMLAFNFADQVLTSPNPMKMVAVTSCVMKYT